MEKVWLTLLILYVLLCLFYTWLLIWKSGSWQKGFCSFVLGISFPGIGFLFLWFVDALAEKKRFKDNMEFYFGNEFRRDELYYLKEPDREKDLNQVTMREALKINEFEYRRNMIMQLLNEEDTLQYLDVLQEALDNEDSETSHYASTVIMELQRKMQEELMEKELFYEKNRGDVIAARDWEQLLFRVLGTNLYDEFNKKRFFVKYERVSDEILSREHPDEAYFCHRIETLFWQKDYMRAQEICQRYLDEYPGSEDPVYYQILLFIWTKDAEGMRRFMRSLSDRPVVLTQKTLKYIRVFKKE